MALARMYASQRRSRGNRKRLRAAASFQGFRPYAIATCPVIADPKDENTNIEKDAGGQGKGSKEEGRRKEAAQNQHFFGLTIDPSSGSIIPNRPGNSNPQGKLLGSICAVAGPEGIACFHSTTPDEPYTILRHVSPSSRHVSALAFQPTCLSNVSTQSLPTSQMGSRHFYGKGAGARKSGSGERVTLASSPSSGPLLLASASGNGVMIWDASGNSLSPLLARLTCSVPSLSSPLQQQQGLPPEQDLPPKEPRGLHHRASSVMPSSPSLTAGHSAFTRRHRASSSLTSSQLSDTLNSALGDDALRGSTTSSSGPALIWDEVTSLCWKPSSSSPCLITSSCRQISLWDLRASMCKGNIDSPSQRLATITSSTSEGGRKNALTKFVHVSYSATNPHTIAAMDISGIVHLYDDRMNVQVGQKAPILGNFRAHTGRGVGIVSILSDSMSRKKKSDNSSGLWVTWGWDAHEGDPATVKPLFDNSCTFFNNISHCCTAKVWTEVSADDASFDAEERPASKHALTSEGRDAANEDYWFFDASSADNSVVDSGESTTKYKRRSMKKEESLDFTADISATDSEIKKEFEFDQVEFELVSHLKSTPIYCVRACPEPFRNSFVTVGPAKGTKTGKSDKASKFHGHPWKAQMWSALKKQRKSSENSLLNESQQLVKQVSSFLGGGVGIDPSMDYLVGNQYLRDQKLLESHINDSDAYGHLLGTDLCLATLDDPALGAELELCCLSSKGFVTNHAIVDSFDRSPRRRDSPSAAPNNASPARVMQQMKYLQAAMPSETIYGPSFSSVGRLSENDDNRDLVIPLQFRRQWQRVMTDVTSSVRTRDSLDMGRQSQSGYENDGSFSRLRSGSTQFDMEPYGNTDETEQSGSPTIATFTAQKNRAVNLPSTVVLDSSTAKREPCPRICGATFSPGGNGLVMFQNGDVSKTWTTFQSFPSFMEAYDEKDTMSEVDSASKSSLSHDYPKTLLDLLKMKKAAKVAEWADDDEIIASNASVGHSSTTSDESMNSLDDDVFSLSLFEKYFTKDHDVKLSIQTDPGRESSIYEATDEGLDQSRATASEKEYDDVISEVPSSASRVYHLGPIVTCTRRVDTLWLSGQSASLALGLKLGGWRNGENVRTVSKICRHNSEVCRREGSSQKANIWEILSQLVVYNKSTFGPSSPTSVAGSYGDDFCPSLALGKDFVSSILRFYEVEGDVQMLATIVCVLSGGNDRRKTVKSASKDTNGLLIQKRQAASDEFYSGTLLVEDDIRYDGYIHLYAKLLYGWGLLEVRNELMKHFAFSLPGAGGEIVLQEMKPKRKIQSYDNHPPNPDSPMAPRKGIAFVPNYGVGQGIDFAPLCPRCTMPADYETNVCPNCQDFGFRCAICANSVRGLFTSCFSCGHGGHVEHMMDWFTTQTLCPSGCGCSCVFNTFDPKAQGP